MDIELFDVYTGAGTPPGKKSLAFALRFVPSGNTLSIDPVSAIIRKMTAAVSDQLKGELREK